LLSTSQSHIHTHKLTTIYFQSHRSTIIHSLIIIHPHQDLHEHTNNHKNTSRITQIYQESQKYISIMSIIEQTSEKRREKHESRIYLGPLAVLRCSRPRHSAALGPLPRPRLGRRPLAPT
jgi:hypothetical protein